MEHCGKENFIVMDLKGPSLALFKKNMGKNFTDHLALDILIQIIEAI